MIVSGDEMLWPSSSLPPGPQGQQEHLGQGRWTVGVPRELFATATGAQQMAAEELGTQVTGEAS